MPPFDVLLLRFFLVIVVGGLIGAEREYRSKSAGFRTMILICLGSFLFTTFSIYISGGTDDRIASNIVTGIGFLGAGVIFQSENRINGLTTAAAIWATAALGMGIADGLYGIVLGGTSVVLISLFFFTWLENAIEKFNKIRIYRIVSPYKPELMERYEAMFDANDLRYKRMKRSKSGPDIIGFWEVRGKEKNHSRFIESIMHEDNVKEFDF
ncbi:MAG TPA: MgtC/SapB family protein [Chitinophagaceae bacterium]|jgi:putative Mg2+ transporter-C (MgtC) family protein|nr:MgtC/SapB family protein [Chitinophagaceae bacterium]